MVSGEIMRDILLDGFEWKHGTRGELRVYCMVSGEIMRDIFLEGFPPSALKMSLNVRLIVY